ncbi:MAG TPA: helix-turn-helix transcriptional regulator [Pseudoflavonifractor sp.]|nr:helix-turn-helix transcriptional regulator [Pseudoflavonifractor sp.]
MIDTKGIGRRIQRLRKEKGLTQEQVAEALDMSVNYLSNIETGRDICSTALLLGIANILNASMDYILGENLSYNKMNNTTGEQHALLAYMIGTLDEDECRHLRKYISLMRESSK